MSHPSQRPFWFQRILSLAASFYLHLVGKTSFFQKFDHASYLPLRRERKPCIYAFWHNSQVILAYAHRGEQAAVMVSQSRDGEYIARVMEDMDLVPIRGSSSRRGEQALRDMISRLKVGGQVAFTPDGPKGPSQKIDGGVILASRVSGAPIVPTAAHSRRRLVFKSWDRFVLPLPFGLNVIAHGQPMRLDPSWDEAMAKEKIREALNNVTDEAERVDQRTPSWVSLFSGTILFCLYNIGLFILAPLLMPVFLLFFGVKRGLLDMRERFHGGVLDEIAGERIWFHAASLGEWQALKPLLAHFIAGTTFSMLVTTSAPEVKAIIKKEFPGITVSLLPVDLWPIVRRWVKKVKPQALIILETELWPNLVSRCEKENIPIFLVNGRLSTKSFQGWRRARSFIGPFMRSINYIFPRTQLDYDHFLRLGAIPDRMEILGNMKVDNLSVCSMEEKAQEKMSLFGLKDAVILIAGSTWPGEEELMIKIISQTNGTPVRLVLAPRRLERIDELKNLISKCRRSFSLWSHIKISRQWTTDVLLVDTFGDLKNLYRAADVGFVGGSVFPRGGQNPLEPAAARLPLIMGPHMENFAEEAIALELGQGAFRVLNEQDLLFQAGKLIQNETVRNQMARNASRVVQEQQGASRKVYSRLHELLAL